MSQKSRVDKLEQAMHQRTRRSEWWITYEHEQGICYGPEGAKCAIEHLPAGVTLWLVRYDDKVI